MLVDEKIHFEKTKAAAEELKSFLERAFKYMNFGETPIELHADEPYTVSVEISKEDIIIDIDYREVEDIGLEDTIKELAVCYDIMIVEHYPGVHMYKDGSGEPPSEELVEHDTKYSLLNTVSEILELTAKLRHTGTMQNLEAEFYEMQEVEEITD